MFFVFGPSGQMYRGGAENLSSVAPVRRVQRPQALRTRSLDEQALPELPVQPAAHPVAPPVNLRLQDAVSAYAQTEQGPQQARKPLTLVSDVMTQEARTVPPEAMVNDAWQTLRNDGIAVARREPRVISAGEAGARGLGRRTGHREGGAGALQGL